VGVKMIGKLVKTGLCLVIMALVFSNSILWYEVEEARKSRMNIQDGLIKNFALDDMSMTLTANVINEVWNEVDNKETSIADAVEKNLPSVVHIFAYNETHRSWEGSGVIVSSDGLIITAAHVIGDANQSYLVTMNDGKQYVATRAIKLEKYDVGYLKIDAKDLPVSNIASFKSCKPGDSVHAIGSPFGYDHFNSVTQGVISATKRDLSTCGIPGWGELFQTDCTSNGGNSGCPIYNSQGDMIGIIVGAYTLTGGYNGITFCVPSDIVLKYMTVVSELFKTTDFSLMVL
jgi:S1-C subfamily serine protease